MNDESSQPQIRAGETAGKSLIAPLRIHRFPLDMARLGPGVL
jgi:hypothetical protein